MDESDSGRFVANPSLLGRTRAAREYVSNMTANERAWLYRKPFCAEDHSQFFSEVYSVLNLLKAMNLRCGNSVLEVGSGPGWVTEILGLLGMNVTCIEPAADMISIAKERLNAAFSHHRVTAPPSVAFLECTMEDADLNDETFDAVLFHEALHHTVDERATMRKVFRSLKKGGVLGISEWCWRPGDTALEASLTEAMVRFGTLESPFTRDYLDRLLREAGFADVTRYHAVNGFMREDWAERTIEQTATAKASRTNNLTAVRPYDFPTSRDRTAWNTSEVELVVHHKELLVDQRIVKVVAEIRNRSAIVLLSAGIGGVTISLCTGRLGAIDFSEAGRIPLPRPLCPGEQCKFECVFALPVDFSHSSWRLDLIAEEVAWFNLTPSLIVLPASAT